MTAHPQLHDIRWKQRLNNFQNALQQLTDAVALRHQRPLSRLEQQGLIKAFEFTHELAWNVMKDYFEYQGNTAITGSRVNNNGASRSNSPNVHLSRTQNPRLNSPSKFGGRAVNPVWCQCGCISHQ